jgi:hypothetical protein
MAKKNEAKKESESESKESEHESKESGHGKESENHHEDDGGDDHDDEDQDKALILQMLKKQGLVDDDDDGTSEACHEAMEMGGKYMAAYKAAGHKAAEAAHRAAEAMKCAADVHAAAAHKSKDDGDDGHEDDDGDDKPAKQKEANAVIELKAEVARLRESVRKSEIEKYLDKKLKESGLPVHVTKLFRESVANAKTQKEIDRGFDTFMKVYKLDRKEDFVESIEKNIPNSNAKQVSSLDDCVETF